MEETLFRTLSQESEKMDKRLPHPPPPEIEKRFRRRGREISSRYMMTPTPLSTPSSPTHPSLTSSSSFSPKIPTFPHPLVTSCRNQLHHPKPRPIHSVPSSQDAGTGSEPETSLCYADENRRSFETPLPLPLRVEGKAPGNLKRRVVRLFSDNSSDTPQPQIIEHQRGIKDSSSSFGRPRSGTPMATDRGINTPRPFLYGQTQLRLTKKTATQVRKSEVITPFPITKDGGFDSSSSLADSVIESCSISRLGGQCHSPPIRAKGSCRARQDSELRSSMPEADLLPTNSERRQEEVEETMCRRSLNSALPSCQPSPFNLPKTVNSKTAVHATSNSGRICLPPQPPSSRLGLDMKKGRKWSSKKEDVNLLGLLHNQYLLWRFVNAKAKVKVKAQVITAERSLAEVSEKVEELRDSVIEKKIELQKLKRIRSLSNILDVEMPYLEDWALVDEEHSTSLSGTIKALQDASIRLPVIGDVRVDFWELKEAFHSVNNMLDSLSSSVKRFLPKTDGIGKVTSELARVASREKALIEECGGLLSVVQALQVNECSLRSMLMQANRSSII